MSARVNDDELGVLIYKDGDGSFVNKDYIT